MRLVSLEKGQRAAPTVLLYNSPELSLCEAGRIPYVPVGASLFLLPEQLEVVDSVPFTGAYLMGMPGPVHSINGNQCDDSLKPSTLALLLDRRLLAILSADTRSCQAGATSCVRATKD